MGFDISWAQCGQTPPPRAPIGVVQVTAGSLDQGPNPCLRQESNWAGAGLSDYIFMDAYSGGASRIAMRGPAEGCAVHNAVCRAYDYGFNWATHWVRYAISQGLSSREWWLDVEQTGSWGSVPVNEATINGAVSALRSQHVGVGIYSTPYQWKAIAGIMTFPGVALWVPGAGNVFGGGYSATRVCKAASSESFADGRLQMVQWGYRGGFLGAYSGASPFDLDYAC